MSSASEAAEPLPPPWLNADRQAESARPTPVGRVPLGKHCWVVDAPDHPGAWPGLLVQWHRHPGGIWVGQVAVIAGEVGDQQVVEIWIEAGYLRPA